MTNDLDKSTTEKLYDALRDKNPLWRITTEGDMVTVTQRDTFAVMFNPNVHGASIGSFGVSLTDLSQSTDQVRHTGLIVSIEQAVNLTAALMFASMSGFAAGLNTTEGR